VPKNLISAEVAALTRDGTWRVDRGLYLQIRNDGSKRSWLFRYRRLGRTRWMGLGSALDVKLVEARGAADDARRLLRHNIDPIEHRRAERATTTMTFEDCAKAYIEAHKASWSNEKHAYQWSQSLEQYAYPTIGKLRVDTVNANHIVKLLEPIWSTKSETAGRLRNRIERVLDWAENAGHRTGKNPARWRGGLEHRLPPLSRVQRIQHHVAVPVADAPAVYARLAAIPRTSAKALRFAFVTAVRAGEALGARWEEFDVEARVWTIPAERTKTKRVHRVPLSDESLVILHDMRGDREHPTGLVFNGQVRGKEISDATLRKLLRKVSVSDADTHGLRSTFRDWAAERTAYPREVAEAALAHIVGSDVERAYFRSDLFQQRAKLMADWSTYLTEPEAPSGQSPAPASGGR
jgi:integrase